VKGLKNPVENDEVIVVYGRGRLEREEVNLVLADPLRQTLTYNMWTEKFVVCSGRWLIGTSGCGISNGNFAMKSRKENVSFQILIP